MKLIKFSESQSKVKSYTQRDGTRVKSFVRRNKKKILAGVGVSALLGGSYLLSKGKIKSSNTPKFTLNSQGLKRYPVDLENDAYINIVSPFSGVKRFQDKLVDHNAVKEMLDTAAYINTGTLKNLDKDLSKLSLSPLRDERNNPAENIKWVITSIRFPRGAKSVGTKTRYNVKESLSPDIEYEVFQPKELHRLPGLEDYILI